MFFLSLSLFFIDLHDGASVRVVHLGQHLLPSCCQKLQGESPQLHCLLASQHLLSRPVLQCLWSDFMVLQPCHTGSRHVIWTSVESRVWAWVVQAWSIPNPTPLHPRWGAGWVTVDLTLSLPRVINIKFPLTHLTAIKYNYYRVPRNVVFLTHFLNLGVMLSQLPILEKGLILSNVFFLFRCQYHPNIWLLYFCVLPQRNFRRVSRKLITGWAAPIFWSLVASPTWSLLAYRKHYLEQ